jgi:type III pantothenate kinase
VVDGVTGRLVRPRDPAALADALVEVLGDPALAARFGNAGAKRVRERFTWPIVARTIASHMGLEVSR